MKQELYDDLRDAFAAIVAAGRRTDAQTETLERFYHLLNLYDAVCGKKQKGCVFAVYGIPNMGKSTLLNSLMQESILPVKPINTTGSVIELQKDENRDDYKVVCWRNGHSAYPNYFSDAQSVCSFLDKHATQNNPCESITITGPFPNACRFMTDGCILRDTPGVEAALEAESERPVDARLRADSDKALASIGDNCIPLFCVNAQTIGQQQDKEFYDRYFTHRCCLHVLTHIDSRSDDIRSIETQSAIDDFAEKFGIFPSAIDPKPVVCTGIKNHAEGNRFVNIGLDELEESMKDFLPEQLQQRLFKVSQFILDEKEKDVHIIDWEVPQIYWKKMQVAVDKLTEIM